jgi:N-acetylmuramoyl-L-alanine amidase
MATDASDFDIEIMARTVYGEARGESRTTQLGVAAAMVNRHKAGKWFSGETLAECCAMHAAGNKYGQFSCWNVFDPNYSQMFRVDENNLILVQCRGCVNEALGEAPQDDIVRGATHYANLNVCDPDWVDSATKTVTIGKLTFFKDVN